MIALQQLIDFEINFLFKKNEKFLLIFVLRRLYIKVLRAHCEFILLTKI